MLRNKFPSIYENSGTMIALWEVEETEIALSKNKLSHTVNQAFISALEAENDFSEYENLFPPFSEWSLHPTTTLIEDYLIIQNSTMGGQDNDIDLPCLPNTTYTFTVDTEVLSGEGYLTKFVRTFDSNDEVIQEFADPTTFTTEFNVVKVRCIIYPVGDGLTSTLKAKNPMLTIGSTIKPFIPQHKSLIDRWETIFGLPNRPGVPLADRQATVKAKMRGIGVVNVAQIKRTADAFTNGDVQVTEKPSTYEFEIKFTAVKGIPPNLTDLQNAINQLKPAHLNVTYLFAYNSWNTIDNRGYTWNSIDSLNKTWDQFDVL